MNLELKVAIVEWMLNNPKEFQIVNATTEKFRQYIYTPEGEFCIGGRIVSNFISEFEKLMKS